MPSSIDLNSILIMDLWALQEIANGRQELGYWTSGDSVPI